MKLFHRGATGRRLAMVGLALLMVCPAGARKQRTARGDAAAVSERDEKFNALYLESVVQREKGNRTAQFELLERAVALNPEACEALYDLAEVAAEAGVYPDSVVADLYGRAWQGDSTNRYYLESYARYEMQHGRYDNAVTLLERLAKDPLRRDMAFQMLVVAYERLHRGDDMLRTLNAWERAEGESEELSVMKMKALLNLKRYDEAASVVKQLADENPMNSYYPIALADIYLQKGDTAAAWAQYREAIARDADNLTAQTFLVNYRQHIGDQEGLMQAVEAVILNNSQPLELRVTMLQNLMQNLKNTPDERRVNRVFEALMLGPIEDKELPELYAGWLAAQNAPDSAYVPAMQRLLGIDPADDRARLVMVQQAINARSFRDVANECSEGIKYHPEKLVFYQIGAGALAQLKDTTEALRLLAQGERYAVGSDVEAVSNFYAAYGDVLHEAGRVAEAYARYDSALVYNSQNVLCLNNYAYFLSLDSAQLDRAKTMSERSLKLEPDNPTYLDTYAWILFMMGDYEAAKGPMDEALKDLKDEPADANLYDHAGDIYYHLGHRKEALEFWRRAKQLGLESDVLEKKIKTQKYWK